MTAFETITELKNYLDSRIGDLADCEQHRPQIVAKLAQSISDAAHEDMCHWGDDWGRFIPFHEASPCSEGDWLRMLDLLCLAAENGELVAYA